MLIQFYEPIFFLNAWMNFVFLNDKDLAKNILKIKHFVSWMLKQITINLNKYQNLHKKQHKKQVPLY